jgi:hypothetical protein
MRLIVLHLDVPTLTTSRLRDPSSQRWNYIYKPLFLDVSTFTTSRLLEILAARGGTTSRLLEILAAKVGTNVGERWPMNFAWNARLPRNIQGSFTCRKSTTWDQRMFIVKARVHILWSKARGAQFVDHNLFYRRSSKIIIIIIKIKITSADIKQK